MIKQGEVVEQCQLCNATKSARSCVFSAKPTDELLRCSETRKIKNPMPGYGQGTRWRDIKGVPGAPGYTLSNRCCRIII